MIIFAITVFIYAILYPPFISIVFVPDNIRIAFEFFTLLFLLFVYIKYRFFSIPKLLIIFIIITLLTYLLVINDPINLLSSLNKIIFIILLIKVLQEKASLTEYFRIFWIVLWSALSLAAILCFISFHLNLLKFHELEHVISYYYYYSHPILGNIRPKDYEMFQLGRVAGYMFEHGQLAFFFGFNVIASKYLIDDPLQCKMFMIINLLAGMVTFSFTFYILLPITLLYAMYIYKKWRNDLLISTIYMMMVLSIIFFLFWGVGLEDYSSLADREARFNIGLSMLLNNNIKTMLFGNGIAFTLEEGGLSISSGLFNILVSRGLLCLIYIMYLTYQYTKYNIPLLIYILLYNMAFEFYWAPIFWLGVATAFADNYHKTAAVARESDLLPTTTKERATNRRLGLPKPRSNFL